MRIVQSFRRFRFEDGGVVRAVIDLSCELARVGHEVTVLTADASDFPTAPDREAAAWPEVVEDPGLAHGARMMLPGATIPSSARSVIETADVVHLHTPWDPVNIAVARDARALGVPYVVSPHGMLDDWSMAQKKLKKRLFLALGASRMLNGASAVHCTAEAERSQAKRWFPGTKGVAIPLVFDVTPFERLPGPEEAREAFPQAFTGAPGPRVLFLSRLHYKKGPDIFLEVLAGLRDLGLDVTGVLAGPGEAAYERELRQRADDLGVADQAFFVGHVGGTLKLSLYQACDVMILPTSQENFGFVFLESMACRTPLVTTYGVDTHPELQASGGAVIAERDPQSLAEAAAGLLRDSDRLGEAAEAGRAWTLEQFAPGRVAEVYVEMYHDARARSGGAA